MKGQDNTQQDSKKSLPISENGGQDKELTFIEHLAELRYRIIVIIISVTFFAIFSYIFSNKILDFIISPVKQKLYYFSPPEFFVFRIKFSVVIAVIITVPIIIYEIWAFVSPGLRKIEKKWLLIIFPPVLVLFLSGATFATLVVVPILLKFLFRFAGTNIKSLLSVGEFISFWVMIVTIFGFSFELPALIILLVKLNILSVPTLNKTRFYFYIVIMIVAAALTPPDIFSCLLFAIPLLLLFEITTLFSNILNRYRLL